VEAALVERWEADPDQAGLLAQLSGGRMGWAVQAHQNTEALTARDLVLDDLAHILGENRVRRFQRAETMARNLKTPQRQEELRETLLLWQGFWRDVVLIATESRVPVVNRDRRALLNRLAREIEVPAAQRALQATRRTLDDMQHTNVNMRLAVEVMLLDYPGLTRD